MNISIYVNGKRVSAKQDENLLEVLKTNGFEVPALCYHKGLPSYGSCRLCTVEVKTGGRKRIIASCTYPVREEGIEVFTESARVNRLRNMIIKFLMARAPSATEIQKLAKTYEIDKQKTGVDEEENSEEKCILCGKCVRTCNDILQKHAISFVNRGIDRKVAPPFEEAPEDCIGCSACVYVCPTGAITEKLENNTKHIKPWEAEHKLVRCPECNKVFMPQETIDEVASKLEPVDSSSTLCLDCRRKQAVKKLDF